MRTVVIGDIHGCYDELVELISTLEEEGEYKKGVDKLVFLGDYIDRGDNSRLVIEFIQNLQKNNDNVIALMGNHEDMLLGYLDDNDPNWTLNGYVSTMNSYEGFEKQFKRDVQWIRTLPLYHEDEYFIFVHAGIDPYKPMKKHYLFFTELNHFASSSKARRYCLSTRAATKSIFSSSVISIVVSFSRSTSLYLGLLFLKIYSSPCCSVILATLEKF